MTAHMGAKHDKNIGFAIIESCLKRTQNESILAETQSLLAKAEPLMSRPFIWNSQPEFVAATLGIEHPMYA
jgi:hypothetical protein